MIDRKIHTTQERRANQDGQWIKVTTLWIGEIWIKIRPKRVKLPNSYDDIMRTDWKHRSWKRHRKTQYH